MLDLNKLEMQLDKALLEDDLEEWILNKRKKNNLMVQINKWYWYPERDYYARYVSELRKVTDELKKKYGTE